MYINFFKRIIDILCALAALVVFCWLYLILAVLIRVKLGSPVLFVQVRPGRKKDGTERLFRMYKFRTMTNEIDDNNNLLPDDARMTKFGSWLRATSLDELPEAFNILKGDMSVIGPRPQLVRDMVFMTEEQRKRHDVRPGLSGLAQVRGRNAISWDDKLATDLEYLENITFFGDVRIIFQTVGKIFKREGITQGDLATAEDLGDYLLRTGRVTESEYQEKQKEAKELLQSRKA